ncbi:MAG: S41 family peptidase [Bacilli bacterium]|nr:S41 family peptidase [Bacilli bacterium]
MDKRVFKLTEVIVVVIITAVLSAIVTGFVSYNALVNFKKVSYVNLTNDKDLQEFIEVYAELVTDYYKDVDRKELLDSAITAMTTYLDEKYTMRLSKEDATTLFDSLSGQYQGVGIEILPDRSINTVFENSPAAEAGIQKGDIIIKVNNEDVTDYESSEVAALIKSNKNGDKVSITVKRSGKEKTFEVKLSNVNIPSVYSSIEDGTHIGYIYINAFNNNTYFQFREKLEELEKKNITSLIIDVRSNGGGYLISAKQIASLFIEQGKVIYSLADKNAKIEYKDETKESRSYPIVVLINGNSASASEILTAALIDSYGATTVGKTSFGKGKVQQTKELNDGSTLKYTSANWLRPNGECIDEVGIKPDYEVDVVLQDGKVIDAQYNKAVEILKKAK